MTSTRYLQWLGVLGGLPEAPTGRQPPFGGGEGQFEISNFETARLQGIMELGGFLDEMTRITLRTLHLLKK